MKKNCLTCKYEPDWEDPVGVEYRRRIGKCKFVVDWPKLPWIYLIQKRALTRYSDDSGLPVGCQTWEPK